MLPEHIWSALIEVSLLFQSICSTTLVVHKLHELENSVAIILYNLEKIFPPAFFDSMEHLIVHLPYEARVGGASAIQRDCDDKSMFKVVKSQAKKFLSKQFADACSQLSAKNKINWTTNPKATATVYRRGSSSVGAYKRKKETQHKCPVNQMEVFEKIYKKKDDDQWSGDVLEAVGERERQQNNNEESSLLSQGSVALNEQQLLMSTAGGQKRGRVFGLGSKAHHTLARPSHPDSSTAPTPLPPQPHRPDLDHRVQMIERYIRSVNLN
ncbi:UNVERIFIED_CONTAM: hypothetical protein Scaly_2518100 [Sesamum calycinum]|uniref:DUF4218 domain-containing protein n=1 Tax=Sesamum calycinum TaxID=2727403 RepID=A0AAW2LSF6_9LAMI